MKLSLKASDLVSGVQRVVTRTASLSKRDVGGCDALIAALAGELPRISKEMGEHCLRSSELLEPLTSGARNIEQHGRDLVALAAALRKEESPLHAAEASVAPAFTFLKLWKDEVQTQARELDECADVFAGIHRSEAALRELVSPLAHMRTMFRIEAAQLPEDVRQVFEGLTEGITGIHREVSETSRKQFAIVLDAIRTLDKVRERIHRQSVTIAESAAVHKAQTAETFARLKQEIGATAAQEASLHSANRTITSWVDRIVMALEAHDITSQRLEAVSKAFAEMRRLLPQGSAGAQRVWCLLKIQQAQLEGTGEHLMESEQTLEEGAAHIQGSVSSMDGAGAVLPRYEAVFAATEANVQACLHAIGSVRKLIEDVLQCSTELQECVHPLGTLTNALSTGMQTLANQMRLIALNAQVQAVQIGSGTGLEVLAAETADVSRQTSDLADNISAGISRVVALVRGLETAFAGLLQQGAGIQAGLSREHLDCLHALEDCQSSAAAHMDGVRAALDSLRRSAETLVGESQARKTAIGSVQGSVAVLGDLELVFESRLGEIDRRWAPEIESEMYRMHSQRAAHHSAISALDVKSGVTEDAPEPKFEVELF